MAEKTTVMLIDDIDGSEAEETVSFALDGTNYLIDLSPKNAKAFRNAIAQYVSVARKEGRGGARPVRRAAGTRAAGRSAAGRGRKKAAGTMDREQAGAIRTWARQAGYKISDRGRIPAEIVEEFNATV